MTGNPREPLVAAVAIVVVSIAHSVTVSPLAPETAFGWALGYFGLFLVCVSIIGLVLERPWGRDLLALVGASITVGFFVTHILPIHSYFTDPYVGVDGLGFWQWGPAIGAMVFGAWATLASLRARQRELQPA